MDIGVPVTRGDSALAPHSSCENVELDIFDLELQKEVAASNRQQSTSKSSRANRSHETTLFDTEIRSVAEEVKLLEVIRDTGSSSHLIMELAAVIRRHCQQRSVGEAPMSTHSSAPTLEHIHPELEEDLSLVRSAVEEMCSTFNQKAPCSARSGAAITVSLLEKHEQLTSAGGMRSNGVRTRTNGDRNTIDTEVSDSLYRLQASKPHPSCSNRNENVNTVVDLDFSWRPANPYNGCAHGSFTTPKQAPQTEIPEQFREGKRNTSAESPVASSTTNFQPYSYGRVTMVQTARDGRDLEYPRPVRPNMKNGQRSSRGPRSETGKNICPSNYSAFSECSGSGGESRSVYSTEQAKKESSSITTTTEAEVVQLCA